MAVAPVASTPAARRRALARAEAGKSLSPAELTALLESRGDDLSTLCAIGARQRDLGWGDTVTYSRKNVGAHSLLVLPVEKVLA